MIDAAVEALVAEAEAADERRLLVLAGSRDVGLRAAETALAAGEIDPSAAVSIGPPNDLPLPRVAADRAADLLGTTNAAVVFDAHDGLDPNALGRTIGTVRGGGLFVLLAPPLDAWPERRDGFDETIAVPPFDPEDVTGHFRRRLVETLRAHDGVAIVDVDRGRVERDGLTDAAPRRPTASIEVPADRRFPREAYEACLTRDQVDALAAMEGLSTPGTAVVIEADRGRGKSSAAGLAAACLAADGEDVLITAPAFRNARPAFERADALLASLEAAEPTTDDADPPRRIDAGGGGVVRFLPPDAAVDADPDVLVVDEAAAFPVARLERFLDVDRVAFATTIHGYEGAGRGFSVRFRDHLAASDHDVTEVSMAEPIRYAAGDPVEVWATRALLLDAGPAADQLVEAATIDAVEYLALEPADLLADEPLLRETFGLLVLAHYRTEPADLARLLDAPNVSVRALRHDGHVVSVALLAREGNLPADRRAAMYDGGRVRGNMLPDVLTTQLRDEAAGVPVGQRVMRIATHDAVRSRGLGSHLLERVRAEFEDEVDWLGTGYGATPDLLDFWRENGYRTVHLSTTRNDASGEHSAIMLRPTSEAGRELHDRHAGRFVDRIGAVLADPLDHLDPDVVRGALRSVDAEVVPDLDDHAWRLVAAAAFGPGLFDVDPGPFRRLAVKQLVEPADPDALDDRAERLLVRKVLQAREWGEVADELGCPSRRQCMRGLGEAFRPLVDAYGSTAAHDERDRYR